MSHPIPGEAAIPPGYTKMPNGVRCRCLSSWTDNGGQYWCCNGTPVLTTPELPEAPIVAKPLVERLREDVADLERCISVAAAMTNPALKAEASLADPKELLTDLRDALAAAAELEAERSLRVRAEAERDEARNIIRGTEALHNAGVPAAKISSQVARDFMAKAVAAEADNAALRARVAELEGAHDDVGLLIRQLEAVASNGERVGEIAWHPQSPLAEQIAKVKFLLAAIAQPQPSAKEERK